MADPYPCTPAERDDVPPLLSRADLDRLHARVRAGRLLHHSIPLARRPALIDLLILALEDDS